jgi:hypothetical protein
VIFLGISRVSLHSLTASLPYVTASSARPIRYIKYAVDEDKDNVLFTLVPSFYLFYFYSYLISSLFFRFLFYKRE